MNCKECNELLSNYLDEEVRPELKVKIDNHLETCEKCHTEYEELKIVKDLLKELPMKKLPEGFEAELHEKLIEASEELKNKKKSKNKNQKLVMFSDHIKRNVKRYSVGVAACLILFVSYETMEGNRGGYKSNSAVEVAREAPQEESMKMAYGSEVAESAPTLRIEEATDFNEMGEQTFTLNMEADDSAMMDEVRLGVADAPEPDLEVSVTGMAADIQDNPNLKNKAASSRKIIQTAYLSMDIENYDDTLESIIDRTIKMGGYIEDMSTSFQYGYKTENPLKIGHVTIRVPQVQFHGVIKSMDEFGQVTDQSLSSDDVTYQYRDIASEVANLEVREKKLREIMEKAVEVKDVLEVERELSQVRGQINNLKGTLIQWDQLVSLSRITINLREVESLEVHIEPIDNRLVTRIRDAFVHSINNLVYSLENLAIILVAMFPFILGYSTIGFVVWKVIKKIISKVKNRR